MAYQQFKVSDTNPNDTTGGGGCICDPIKQTDCKPPYVIFHDTYMEDPRSPYTVACQACLLAGAVACNGEVLSIGEKNLVDGVPYAPPIPDAEVVEDDEDLPDV